MITAEVIQAADKILAEEITEQVAAETIEMQAKETTEQVVVAITERVEAEIIEAAVVSTIAAVITIAAVVDLKSVINLKIKYLKASKCFDAFFIATLQHSNIIFTKEDLNFYSSINKHEFIRSKRW